jgi:hypothetical protein
MENIAIDYGSRSHAVCKIERSGILNWRNQALLLEVTHPIKSAFGKTIAGLIFRTVKFWMKSDIQA